MPHQSPMFTQQQLIAAMQYLLETALLPLCCQPQVSTKYSKRRVESNRTHILLYLYYVHAGILINSIFVFFLFTKVDIPTKNLPYLLTEESFHLLITVVLLRGGPFFWHIIQFISLHAGSALHLCYCFQVCIFPSLEYVRQIVLSHSSHLYCLSFSVRYLLG